jgi:hypothetical protein
MTKTEYEELKNEIQKKYKLEIAELNRQYALSNSIACNGDIVIDHHTRIVVEHVKVAFGFDETFPQCVYYGKRLSKNNKPFKSGESSCIYQDNIKEVIKSRCNGFIHT